MKRMTYLVLGAALALTLNACGDDSRTTTDGGIVLMDSGVGTDSGGGGADSGAGTDGGGGTCPPATVPAPTAPACAASTLECLMVPGCTTEACQQACLEADPAPEACNGCLTSEIFNCATTMGCDQNWGDFQCCAEDNCGAAPTQDCIEAMCVTEYNAFITCATGLGAACGVTGRCFMAP